MLINISGRQTTNLNISCGISSIHESKNLKILGITVDDRLSFNIHINNICDKINRIVSLLYRIRYFMPKNALNLIYKSLVQSTIDYGISLYGFTYKTHYQRIESIQRRAVRLICRERNNVCSLYKSLNWMPFTNRRNYFCSIFIYKCLNRLNAIPCQTLFNYRQTRLRTRSCSNNELVLPNSHLQCYLNTIFYQGVKIYNSLLINIRNCESFIIFIKNVKKFFIDF